jgi:hypothetical protein
VSPDRLSVWVCRVTSRTNRPTTYWRLLRNLFSLFLDKISAQNPKPRFHRTSSAKKTTMLVNKTINNNDDASTISYASGHTWSPNNTTTTSHQEEFLLTSDDAVSAPGRMNQTDEGGLEGLDSHEYPPFASAVPVDTNEQDGDGGFPVVSTPPPVPRIVEVDAENGTIRVEMEQDSQNPMNTGSKSEPSSNGDRSPMSNLTRYQTCWLIVFVRKCARKTRAYSRDAARKYSPKAKLAASRSAAAIKDASARSASLVRSKSVHCKNRAMDFNENHQVGDKTRTSIKVVGRHVKKATKATVKEVKKVSIATAKGIKELDKKHHIVRKSKNSLKTSGRIIRNAWNGKPLNTPVESSSHPAVMVVESPRTTQQEEGSPKSPSPSSE